LYNPILAVVAAIAARITLIDVVSTLEKDWAQAGFIVFPHGIRKCFSTTSCGRLWQTGTGKIFAATMSSILGSALASYHEIIWYFQYALAQCALVDKLEGNCRRRAIYVVEQCDCRVSKGVEIA